jgi:hypothetical protein
MCSWGFFSLHLFFPYTILALPFTRREKKLIYLVVSRFFSRLNSDEDAEEAEILDCGWKRDGRRTAAKRTKEECGLFLEVQIRMSVSYSTTIVFVFFLLAIDRFFFLEQILPHLSFIVILYYNSSRFTRSHLCFLSKFQWFSTRKSLKR